MKKFSKKLMATILTGALVFGLVGVIGAHTTGQDVTSTGKNWQSFSVHGKDGGDNSLDKGEWEKKLIADGQTWALDVKESDKIDAEKTYGECGKITKKAYNGFNFNIKSTGWSANWAPSGKKDAKGKSIYIIAQENPWGLYAKRTVNVDRGRVYNLSFKVKSTLVGEKTILKERADGTKYNYHTGEKIYVKHFHFKGYDDHESGEAGLYVQNVTAKNKKGENVVSKIKDFNNMVKLDSRDEDYVTVSCDMVVPDAVWDDSDLKLVQYQKGVKQNTMGIKFAFGAFLKSFPDENNMAGDIEVKDFKITAKSKAAAPAKAKIKKAKVGKKRVTVKFKKATGAKRYQVQVALKKNFKKGLKTKYTSKTSITIKGLKAKKKYYVRVRGAKGYDAHSYVYGSYSKVKKTKKTKK